MWAKDNKFTVFNVTVCKFDSENYGLEICLITPINIFDAHSIIG